MVKKVERETMVAWRKATGPALMISVNGRVAPSRMMPVLM